MTTLPDRALPVRPDLGQLERQAKELLREIRSGTPAALAELAQFHPGSPDPARAKLADAQRVLARAAGASSWRRLVECCAMVDAIWNDDLTEVHALIARRPALLHEDALVRPGGKRSNWGRPMSYAANLGRDRMIEMLHAMGATDHEHAIGRAVLQSRIETAKLLHRLAGSPPPDADALGGPAYTLSESGTAYVLALGCKVTDADGRPTAPVAVVLETDSRKPAAKHAILEMYAERGLAFPDTAPMALHRGRIDLLERCLDRRPADLDRPFAWDEIYPPEFDCHDELLATHGTPLKGATLLHMCCDYDELEIARWLIARGADVNARAAVDEDGFGGHTPLFSAVVSQPYFWRKAAPFAELLLAHGAAPNPRASLRKQLHPGYDENDTLREYREVTPLGWGRRFHFPALVSNEALALIKAAGGRE